MKKVLVISVLALMAVSCGNSTKEEAQEEKTRDSAMKVQISEDEKFVKEMERKDDSAKAAQANLDSLNTSKPQ